MVKFKASKVCMECGDGCDQCFEYGRMQLEEVG